MPQELFHPKPSHIILECVSSLIKSQAFKPTGGQRHEYAFLLLDEVYKPPVEVSPFTQDTHKKDQELRVKTSGVVILTANDTILGNASELPGDIEEGSAQGHFITNKATVAELGRHRMRTQRRLHYGNLPGTEYPASSTDVDDDVGLDLESWNENGGHDFESWDEDGGHTTDDGGEDGGHATDDGGESTSNEDTGPDSEEEGGEQDNTYDHQFKECIEKGFILYRDPPDLSALSQLDELKSTQVSKKRPRSNNETFTVKRRKGTTMSQIFGSNASSIFPRHI